MGNKKDKKWLLITFTDETKKEIFKMLEFNTINEIAYIVGLKPQEISNYYHKLINARYNLKYCDIFQISI